MAYPGVLAEVLPDGSWRGCYVRQSGSETFPGEVAEAVAAAGSVEAFLQRYVHDQPGGWRNLDTAYDTGDGGLYDAEHPPPHDTQHIWAFDVAAGLLRVYGYVDCALHPDRDYRSDTRDDARHGEPARPTAGCCCYDYGGGFFRWWAPLGAWPIEALLDQPDAVADDVGVLGGESLDALEHAGRSY